MQWYRQDCCWQVPGSWRSDGILPGINSSSSSQAVTQATLDSLPDIPAYASCLFVVHAPAVAAAVGAGAGAADGLSSSKQPPQLLAGEVVVSVERLKRVQLQVGEGVPSGSCIWSVDCVLLTTCLLEVQWVQLLTMFK
jgi:hypothetical protein